MTKYQPLISIIVAVLNGSRTLNHCLSSVASQSYTHRELIVIDGGSVDGTVSIIKSYQEYITYWASEKDSGIYQAWNKALKYAQGEWICFLGSDDFFWNNLVIKNYIPHLKEALDVGIKIVYGRVARIDTGNKIREIWGKPWKRIAWQIPHGMPLGLPHTGLMHHAELFKRNGMFDEQFKLAGDYEFLLRELKNKGSSALFIKDLITVGQQIGGTADSNNFRFHQEVAIARRKNNLPAFSWLWCFVHFRSFLKFKSKSIRSPW